MKITATKHAFQVDHDGLVIVDSANGNSMIFYDREQIAQLHAVVEAALNDIDERALNVDQEELF